MRKEIGQGGTQTQHATKAVLLFPLIVSLPVGEVRFRYDPEGLLHTGSCRSTNVLDFRFHS